MLLKNLKYAHPKVCKSKPPPPPAPPPPIPSIIIEKVVVHQAPAQLEPPKTIEQQYHEQKQTKTEQRKQRIKNLISNAF